MKNINVTDIKQGDYIIGEFTYGNNNKGFYKCVVKTVLKNFKPNDDIDVPEQDIIECEKLVTVNGIESHYPLYVGANELVVLRKMSNDEIDEFNKLFE